ncbi:hypothetical protein TTHERM_000375029 (macronuclear) [Tetrahymena thermophila SB210]|uniref:Uncharacterized protein n=1 Tax=Tetrahymena thermophila (strain SB210) TaxID=312017 RepID=W7XLB6_TETTS|nr:hypothetical protein TTHERM_000375029 [Tetrahymena thermophila SB210]EWS76004.1 hypothetical protein TTHERM_000375029 [Tetrahymena thermophila SB210]|eukprot:XP_012651442.1 hypothetical protein TTHERM_000375029 [Tetrahymena thermophila SB210]
MLAGSALISRTLEKIQKGKLLAYRVQQIYSGNIISSSRRKLYFWHMQPFTNNPMLDDDNKFQNKLINALLIRTEEESY